jgi:hypothetical protein
LLEAQVSDPIHDSPRRTGFRQGLKLVLTAGCLTPLIFLLEGILPGRENTRIDELPQIVLFVGLVGLTLAGIARVAYAFLAESPHPKLTSSDRHLLARGHDATPSTAIEPQNGHIARLTTPVHNTPI